MISLAILAVSAPNAQVLYPAKDVLREFRQICSEAKTDVDHDAPETVSQRVGEWEGLAARNGWLPVKLADAATRNWNSKSAEKGKSERRDFLAVNRISALNHVLVVDYIGTGDGEVVDGNIFSKEVSGRTLYLSTFGVLESSRGLTECRIYDPLGDGILRSPINRVDVAQVWGTKTKLYKGAYGSQEFSFPGIKQPTNSFRVHIAFNGLPLSSSGRAKGKIDPYAIYGMTIVNSQRAEIILI